MSAYGAVEVGVTATLMNNPYSQRKGLMIFNNSSQTVYIGMDSNVTVTTGFPILSNCTFATDDLGGVWKGSVYGIVASGTADTRNWEFSE